MLVENYDVQCDESPIGLEDVAFTTNALHDAVKQFKVQELHHSSGSKLTLFHIQNLAEISEARRRLFDKFGENHTRNGDCSTCMLPIDRVSEDLGMLEIVRGLIAYANTMR